MQIHHAPHAPKHAIAHRARAAHAPHPVAHAKSSGPQTPKARAFATWAAVQRHYATPSGLFYDSPARQQLTDAWPHGQAIAAGLDVAKLSHDYRHVDRAISALSHYRLGKAYAPGIRPSRNTPRFYDDNAWLGLDLMQAYEQTGKQRYLKHARQLFPFFETGVDPRGGLRWEEGHTTRNTCANAPAMELALRLALATPNRHEKARYMAFAENLHRFVNRDLRVKHGPQQGLYYDHIDGGVVKKNLLSYNQGAMIGANVLFYRATGKREYLQQANETAHAALTYLAGPSEKHPQQSRLWETAPRFNAIFFRNLLALDHVAPNPAYRQALVAYTNRLWSHARDPKTGLFNRGFGDASQHAVIDQAAIAQLFAMRAWPAIADGKLT